MSVGICILGQVERLEWGSKVSHLIVPTLNRDIPVGISLVLSDGPARFTNSFSNILKPLFPSIAAFRKKVKQLTKLYSKGRLHILSLNHTVITLTHKIGWLKYLDKHKTLSRQRSHMMQFEHSYRCAQTMEILDASLSASVSIVIKMRDDSRVMVPWVPNMQIGPELKTLKCMKHGGIMDAQYMGERSAMVRALSSMYQDWKSTNNKPYRNPEQWMRDSFRRHSVRWTGEGLCSLPMLSVRVDAHGNLTLKRYHKSAARSCYDGEDTCGLRKAANRIPMCPLNLCNS